MMNYNWKQIVEYVKTQNNWLHFFYSREQCFGHISYKTDRIRIDGKTMSLIEVQKIVDDLKMKYAIK